MQSVLICFTSLPNFPSLPSCLSFHEPPEFPEQLDFSRAYRTFRGAEAPHSPYNTPNSDPDKSTRAPVTCIFARKDSETANQQFGSVWSRPKSAQSHSARKTPTTEAAEPTRDAGAPREPNGTTNADILEIKKIYGCRAWPMPPLTVQGVDLPHRCGWK